MFTVNASVTTARIRQAAIVALVVVGVLATEGNVRSAAAQPAVTIGAPANASAAVAGESVGLVGSAVDPLEGDLGAGLRWESDLQGVLGTGRSVVALGLQPGTHIITARATNSAGITGQARATLRIMPAVLRVAASADTYVGADLPTQSFGDASILAADASPERQAFLRFVVAGTSGLVIEEATLELTVSGKSGSDSDSGGRLHAISDTGWEETTLTYASRPPIDHPALASRGPVLSGERVAFDVTGVVGGDGAVVFALTSASGNVVQYKSRETASGQPALVLRLRSAVVPDAAPTLAITGPADGTLVAPGTVVSLTAAAGDREDGELTAAIAWSSDLVGLLGAGSPLGVRLPAGTHRVRARVMDDIGQMASDEITITVGEPPLVSIDSLAPEAAAVVGESVGLVGSAVDAVEGDLGAGLRWESDLQGVLGTGPSLVALGLQAGTHIITARVTNSAGISGQARVTLRVMPAVLRIPAAADTYVGADLPTQGFGDAAILAADASPERQSFLRFVVAGTRGLVIEEATLELTVSGKSGSDSDRGGMLHAISDTGWEEATLGWASRPPIDHPALASRGPVVSGELVAFDVTGVVGGDGAVVFALTSASGNVVQYKSRETASGQPALVLRLRSAVVPDAAPTLVITGPADGTLVAPGTVVSLSAAAGDREDGELTAAIAWSSDLVGLLGAGSPLAVRLPAGMHRIRAEVADHLGQKAVAEVSLLVNTAPAVTIASPADGTVIAEGAPLVLGARADDAEQGDLSASLVWASDQDGVLGRGATLAVDTLTPGVHTITATVTDDVGSPGSASVGVVVRTGTLSLRPIADTYVAADRPTDNFGTSRTLTADASPERLLFLRFEVRGLGNLPPDRAKIRLTVSDASGSDSTKGGTLRALTDTGWDERRLTYADRPPVDGPVLGTAGRVSRGRSSSST